MIQCSNCGRPVPRDKAKRDTQWISLVDSSLARELRSKGTYIARQRVVKFYCVSCAVHFGLSKVRSRDERHFTTKSVRTEAILSYAEGLSSDESAAPFKNL